MCYDLLDTCGLQRVCVDVGSAVARSCSFICVIRVIMESGIHSGASDGFSSDERIICTLPTYRFMYVRFVNAIEFVCLQNFYIAPTTRTFKWHLVFSLGEREPGLVVSRLFFVVSVLWSSSLRYCRRDWCQHPSSHRPFCLQRHNLSKVNQLFRYVSARSEYILQDVHHSRPKQAETLHSWARPCLERKPAN